MPAEEMEKLPAPGEVDFICGGWGEHAAACKRASRPHLLRCAA